MAINSKKVFHFTLPEKKETRIEQKIKISFDFDDLNVYINKRQEEATKLFSKNNKYHRQSLVESHHKRSFEGGEGECGMKPLQTPSLRTHNTSAVVELEQSRGGK